MAVCGQSGGLPIVLCHGFLELAISWRHQPLAIAAAAGAGTPDRISDPCLMIPAADDLFLPPPGLVDEMEPRVQDLERHVTECCGLRTQVERAEEFNRRVVDWSSHRFGR